MTLQTQWADEHSQSSVKYESFQCCRSERCSCNECLRRTSRRSLRVVDHPSVIGRSIFKETTVVATSISVLIVRPVSKGMECVLDGVTGVGHVPSADSNVCSCLICLLPSWCGARTLSALSRWMETDVVTARAVHHNVRDALCCDADRGNGGVFDGGGVSRINLI